MQRRCHVWPWLDEFSGVARSILLLECCFTETVGLLGTGAQDVHLDFHTAPELWVLFYSSSSSIVSIFSTLLVHAGLFWCFHNPPNSGMDYGLFNESMHVYTHGRPLFLDGEGGGWGDEGGRGRAKGLELEGVRGMLQDETERKLAGGRRVQLILLERPTHPSAPLPCPITIIHQCSPSRQACVAPTSCQLPVRRRAPDTKVDVSKVTLAARAA